MAPTPPTTDATGSVEPLEGRRVVLGVCGGIAAYKAVEVCRRLVDAGAHVVPVMTDGATRFVGEVTLSALASEPVRRSLWDEPDPIPHTRLGQGADLVLVAPATARLMSAYASGYSHDLLTNTLLATRAPVLICPAMHTEMWEHPAVQDNLALLRRRGDVADLRRIAENGRGDRAANVNVKTRPFAARVGHAETGHRTVRAADQLTARLDGVEGRRARTLLGLGRQCGDGNGRHRDGAGKSFHEPISLRRPGNGALVSSDIVSSLPAEVV